MFPGARPFCRLTVWPSGLATGYLWTTLSVQRSLLASRVTYRNFPTSDDDNSRQNPQIRREIRKKIFRDKFFSDENLSESVQNILITIGNTSTSHWPGLSHEAHVTCLGQWESRKSTCDKMGQARRMRNGWKRKPPCLPSMSAETETCRVSFQSEGILIKIRWVHL